MRGPTAQIPVPYGKVRDMKGEFEIMHRKRFGFIARDRRLLVEAVSIEAIGRTETEADKVVGRQKSSRVPEAIDRSRMYSGGRWHDVRLYDRDSLEYGQKINGAAIIVEKTGTVVVEPGWCASVNSRNHLVLERYLPRPQTEAIGTSVDPVMLEVFNNLFMSIAEQMGATLANTSYSVNIKERLDFSCAVFKRRWRTGSQCPACSGPSRVDGRIGEDRNPGKALNHETGLGVYA